MLGPPATAWVPAVTEDQPWKLEQQPEALLSACRAEEAEAFQVELGKHPKLLASYQVLQKAQEAKGKARAARQLSGGGHRKRAKEGGGSLAPKNAGGVCTWASMCLLWCMGCGTPPGLFCGLAGGHACLQLPVISCARRRTTCCGGWPLDAPRQRCALPTSHQWLH